MNPQAIQILLSLAFVIAFGLLVGWALWGDKR
jgi:hypothetical protein